MNISPIRFASALAAVFLVATTASAHDFWIEPSTYRPPVGQLFSTALRVGQDFDGDPIPRSEQLIDAFIVSERGAERPVIGMENRDPAGYVRIESPGLAIIGYRSKPWPLELPAEKFEEFLRMEGLDAIRALRGKRGESAKPDRERFYRFAKSFVVAGNADAKGFERALGYRYELIPETNPMATGPLTVRALYDGKPLAGALVVAIQQHDPATKRTARTGRDGRVVLDLPRGVWLVKSVQMVAAPAGTNVDWESLWASLTFER
jgi:uncharacterized GH25 family protein